MSVHNLDQAARENVRFLPGFSNPGYFRGNPQISSYPGLRENIILEASNPRVNSG